MNLDKGFTPKKTDEQKLASIRSQRVSIAKILQQLADEEKLELQLKSDRDIYGLSYERRVNGKRERLDPTTIRCVTVSKPSDAPKYISDNPYLCQPERFIEPNTDKNGPESKD